MATESGTKRNQIDGFMRMNHDDTVSVIYARKTKNDGDPWLSRVQFQAE